MSDYYENFDQRIDDGEQASYYTQSEAENGGEHANGAQRRTRSNSARRAASSRCMTRLLAISLVVIVVTSILLLAALIAVVIASIVISSPKPIVEPTVDNFRNETTIILISIDGFRWDYVNMFDAATVLPNLSALRSKGVRAKYMNPIFPSKTFPNHYAIATGLYAESHGILSNSMYDPVFNAVFKLSDQNEVRNPRWWGGEPIWVTAEKQGVKTSSVFYPGTDVAISGVNPTWYNTPYDSSYPYQHRVADILNRLAQPKKEDVPRLNLMYMEGVDNAGHNFGPNTTQVRDAIKKVDDAIGLLVQGLKDGKIEEYVDIIIVSDHGMASIGDVRPLNLDAAVQGTSSKTYNYGPFSDFWPGQDDVDGSTIASRVRSQVTPVSKFSVYKRSELPAHWHFANHQRTPPVLAVAEIDEYDAGWAFLTSKNPIREAGTHGFDPQHLSMKATFFASGKHFKKNTDVDPFDNIHVYSLIAGMLGLKPAPTNGTFEAVKHLLAQWVNL